MLLCFDARLSGPLIQARKAFLFWRGAVREMKGESAIHGAMDGASFFGGRLFFRQ